jgi:hypothetical protein
MGQLANTPTWGLLVKAPLERVREILAPFGDDFVFRTNDGWTAAFNMEPGDDRDEDAAARLLAHGHVPIYRFDFSKHGFSTSCWDGERWNEDRDPGVVLGTVGLKAPYWDEAQRAIDAAPLEVREASVLEGASVEQARALTGNRFRVEPGPLGAIVYAPDPDTRFALQDRAPGRVLEIEFYPRSGNFWFRVMKGEECLGTFRPGEAQTSDGTPFLDNVYGETEPGAIVEKLGIPRSFLDPAGA